MIRYDKWFWSSQMRIKGGKRKEKRVTEREGSTGKTRMGEIFMKTWDCAVRFGVCCSFAPWLWTHHLTSLCLCFPKWNLRRVACWVLFKRGTLQAPQVGTPKMWAWIRVWMSVYVSVSWTECENTNRRRGVAVYGTVKCQRKWQDPGQRAAEDTPGQWTQRGRRAGLDLQLWESVHKSPSLRGRAWGD